MKTPMQMAGTPTEDRSGGMSKLISKDKYMSPLQFTVHMLITGAFVIWVLIFLLGPIVKSESVYNPSCSKVKILLEEALKNDNTNRD